MKEVDRLGSASLFSVQHIAAQSNPVNAVRVDVWNLAI